MSYAPSNETTSDKFDMQQMYDYMQKRMSEYRESFDKRMASRGQPRNQLDPNFLTKMIGQLFGQHYTALMPQMQMAINSMRSGAARRGGSSFGVFKRGLKGIPGVFAAEAGKRAAGQAIDTYTKQAAVKGQQYNLPNTYDQLYALSKYGLDVGGGYLAQGKTTDPATFDPFTGKFGG